MLLRGYDFNPGRVIYFNNDLYDIDVSYNNLENLSEDLLQVEFSNSILIDLGWYKRCFIVYVILENNWDKPILRIETNSYKELSDSMDTAMKFIKDYLI